MKNINNTLRAAEEKQAIKTKAEQLAAIMKKIDTCYNWEEQPIERGIAAKRKDVIPGMENKLARYKKKLKRIKNS